MKILWIIFTIVWIILSSEYFFKNTNIENTKNLKIKELNMVNLKNAYFAWGCFWCMEWIFESQSWVKEAIAWYIGWDEKTANYEDVSSWKTSHREWVKIIYDPDIISYEKLSELFWTQIDPTDDWWQFAPISEMKSNF